MSDTPSKPADVANQRRRDLRYGVVGGHNTRCASLLGEGCDCRSPWGEDRVARFGWRFLWLAAAALIVVIVLALPIW